MSAKNARDKSRPEMATNLLIGCEQFSSATAAKEFAEELRRRQVTSSVTLQDILEQPARGGHQHWGINE
jgi:hypothetical protein